MGRYTEQIGRLSEEPILIKKDWMKGKGLFKFASETGKRTFEDARDYRTSGCLTMIRRHRDDCVIFNGIVDEELTNTIRNDKRIPDDAMDITPEHLSVFEYYQELIDQKIAELQ